MENITVACNIATVNFHKSIAVTCHKLHQNKQSSWLHSDINIQCADVETGLKFKTKTTITLRPWCYLLWSPVWSGLSWIAALCINEKPTAETVSLKGTQLIS